MNNSIKELVDLYHPSVLWGDVTIGPIKDWNGKPLTADYWNSKEVLAYFYNHSDDPAEVVANDRWGLDTDGKMVGDYNTPEMTAVGGIKKTKWEECDSLDPTSWGYNRRTKEGEYMTATEVVHYLVDVVSKNGNLLLNVGPRADGTIPEVIQSRLREVGEWLRVNGEAIYGSRAWDTYKDGDVRFTRKGNTLYAIALEWPEEELKLTSLVGHEVQKVEMLGLSEPITWKQDRERLVIEPPAKHPCRYAYAFKITCRNL
jgi:alpha-L-fucosidase